MSSGCRGVRGATTCRDNTEADVLESTRELLVRLMDENGIGPNDLAAIFFTATPDLNAAFPARAAREIGLETAALLGAMEMDVPGAPRRCIRVLLLVNTDKNPAELRHVYLRGAQALRPDRRLSTSS